MHAWDPSHDIASLWLPRPPADGSEAPPALSGWGLDEDLADDGEAVLDAPTMDPASELDEEEPWLIPDDEEPGLAELPPEALESI